MQSGDMIPRDTVEKQEVHVNCRNMDRHAWDSGEAVVYGRDDIETADAAREMVEKLDRSAGDDCQDGVYSVCDLGHSLPNSAGIQSRLPKDPSLSSYFLAVPHMVSGGDYWEEVSAAVEEGVGILQLYGVPSEAFEILDHISHANAQSFFAEDDLVDAETRAQLVVRMEEQVHLGEDHL